MTTIWRKSSYSNASGECVELSNMGAVRDSKNPDGPTVRVDLATFLAAIKTGRFDA